MAKIILFKYFQIRNFSARRNIVNIIRNRWFRRTKFCSKKSSQILFVQHVWKKTLPDLTFYFFSFQDDGITRSLQVFDSALWCRAPPQQCTLLYFVTEVPRLFFDKKACVAFETAIQSEWALSHVLGVTETKTLWTKKKKVSMLPVMFLDQFKNLKELCDFPQKHLKKVAKPLFLSRCSF